MQLIAISHILYKSKQYRPGDVLPFNTEMQELWMNNESAVLIDDSENIKKVTKARSVTAMAGLSGIAVNSEVEENLIGRVPITQRRLRR